MLTLCLYMPIINNKIPSPLNHRLVSLTSNIVVIVMRKFSDQGHILGHQHNKDRCQQCSHSQIGNKKRYAPMETAMPLPP